MTCRHSFGMFCSLHGFVAHSLHDLDLDLLRCFVTVVESAGFTQASKRLHFTRSAIAFFDRPAVTLHGVLVRSNVGACGQFYRHAVGGAPVGVRPGLLARNQSRGIGQALGSDQMLESRKPMIIVVRTVVWFPATRGGVELVWRALRPIPSM